MLYDTFLHELGHLQLVRPKAKTMDRKYAAEPLAMSFAAHRRSVLWAERFEHADPVHNPPTKDEFAVLELWKELNKSKRYELVDLALSAPHPVLPDMSAFGELTFAQRRFLKRALCLYKTPPVGRTGKLKAVR